MTITTQSFVAVNVGTAANDGTGDELRTAFIKLNSNFSNISTSGFNAGNILAAGNVQAAYYLGDGSQLTNISAANAYGNGNVASYLTVYNGVVGATNVFVAGNVTAQWLIGKANLTSILTTDLGASGMIYANAGTQSTSTGTGALVVNGGMGVTGNLTVGNLTVIGTTTTVGTSNLVVSNNFIFLSNNNITNSLDIGFFGQYAVGQGNVYTGLAYRATDGIYTLFSNLNPMPTSTINMANVTPASLALGNILAANIVGTIITPAQVYITSVGNLANLRSSGNITTTGYFFGNGSQLAGLVSYSNVFVATYLPTYSGSIGNITASNLAGATITAIYSNIAVSNSSAKNYVDGQITAANSAVTAANLGLKGYVDSGLSSANVGIIGYIDQGNTIQAASILASNVGMKGYVDAGNLGMKGYVDAQIIASSSYSNVNVAAYLPTYTGTIGSLTTANTSMKTYVDGQINAANVAWQANAYQQQALIGNILISTYGNSNVAAYLVSYSGNISAGRANITGAAGTGIGALNVGIPGYPPFGNAIASFHGNINSPMLLNIHNKNTGSNSTAGVVITADVGDPLNISTVLGMASSNYFAGNLIVPGDSYLQNTGFGNLVIGAQGNVVFYGGNQYETIRLGNGNLRANTGVSISFIDANSSIYFGDGTKQTTAYTGDIPQNNQSANDYVLTSNDRGKHVMITKSTVANIYIPGSANVAWTIGTSITIVNNGTGNANIIANSGVTLYLAGTSTTDANARIVPSHGIATLLNTANNVWYVNGTGVS